MMREAGRIIRDDLIKFGSQSYRLGEKPLSVEATLNHHRKHL
jgi:hypothetical protein